MDYRLLSSFYHANPLPGIYQNEDRMLKDMEYLQQMYPRAAKKYQKKVVDVLDQIDYSGSIIYDEYPDQMCLYRLANEITSLIRMEEQKQHTSVFSDSTSSSSCDCDSESFSNSDEKWEEVGCIVQILLYYEIFKRRHQRKNRIVRIY